MTNIRFNLKKTFGILLFSFIFTGIYGCFYDSDNDDDSLPSVPTVVSQATGDLTPGDYRICNRSYR